MRISTQSMYHQTMGNVIDAQSNWLNTGEKLSTGKKINTPSDDPVSAAQAVVVSQAQSQNKQYGLARTFATQAQALEETILSQVTSVLHSAGERLVYAGNGTLSDDDRISLALDLQGMRDQLLNLANSTDGNGRYIFAGYKTEAPPFVPGAPGTAQEGRIDYHGGDEAIKQNVDASRNMVINHTGRQVFMTLPALHIPEPAIPDPLNPADTITPPAENNIFNVFDDVIASLQTPVTSNDERTALVAAVDKANRGLRNASNNISAVHAQTGVQLQELHNLDELGSQRTIDLKMQKSSLEDADWNQSVSDYKLKMYALSAAYQTFSDMKGLSLFQVNR